MNRRNFLKTGFIASASLMFAGNALNALGEKSDIRFSLELITDDPDRDAVMLETFIRKNLFGNGTIKYSEYPLSQNAMGDIVMINEKQLVNVVSPTDKLGYEISDLRKSLNLPRMLEKPFRIKFSNFDADEISNVFITRKGKIISKIPVNIKGEHQVLGKSGKLIYSVDNSEIKVIKSDCKHQICAKMGGIKKSGDSITCIPNEILIFAE